MTWKDLAGFLNGRSRIIEQAITCLIVGMIFLLPFPHTTAIREICYYLSVFLTLILVVSGKTSFSFRSPLALPFVLFIAWSFFGLFFALNKTNSLEDFYSHLLKYVIFYFVVINSFDSKKGFLTLVYTVIASAAAFSIICGLYFYVVEGNPLSSRISFKEFQINIIGFLTIVSSLMAINLLSQTKTPALRILLIVSTVATLAITLLTQSVGSMLALVLSFMILGMKRPKLVAALGIFIIAAGLFIFPVKERINPEGLMSKLRADDRDQIIWTYIEMIKDHPVTGIGYGMQMWYDQALWDNYASRLPEKKRTIMQDPHNIIVSIAVRTGIVGLFFYLCILFNYGKMALSIGRGGNGTFGGEWVWCLIAAFTVYFVKGMFAPALNNVPAYVCYLLLAMMTILWKLHSPANNLR